jgi:hypothetical protein
MAKLIESGQTQPQETRLQRFVSRLRGRQTDVPSTPSATSQSNFEQELFRNGTYEFNVERDLASHTKYLQRSRDWFENVGWPTDKAASYFHRQVGEKNHEIMWQQHFSGKIPSHWDWYGNVLKDFQKAREQKVSLSQTLVDAGITHIHWSVASEVGTGQKLNVTQLAWALARPDFSKWVLNDILAAQEGMGVSRKDIEAARKLAEQARERMKRQESNGLPFAPSSPSTAPQIEAKK